MNDWMIMSGLCSLGPHLIFFSYMPICQCVVKPSINELLAALFILTPPLQPRWVLSPPRQGAAEVGTPRHPSAPRRQMLSENEDKMKWLCPSLLSSSERSVSLSCISSRRGGPGHIAIAWLNRIHCLTACRVSLQRTLQEVVRQSLGWRLASTVLWGKLLPFLLAIKDDQGKQSRITQFICRFLILHLPVAWKLGRKISTTVDFVAACLL